MAYLNNIIIYLNSEKEHKEHKKWGLKKLYKEDIPVIIKNRSFILRRLIL